MAGVLTGFLVGYSYSMVHINENILIYDHLIEDVYTPSPAYQPGRHFIGLSKSFVRFPANNILIGFLNSQNSNLTEASQTPFQFSFSPTLFCRTFDGLNLNLDVSFYYSLNSTNLLNFYLQFGNEWQNTMVTLARSAIKNITASYTSQYFYRKRFHLQTKMRNLLQTFFDFETNNSLTISYFQFQFAVFSGNFENSIVSKLIQQHYFNLYNYQGQINLINANTTVFSNNTYNQINLTLANATSIGIQNNLNLKSKALVSYLQNMTIAYNNIKGALGLNWIQMYPLMYAIELKTKAYLNKKIDFVPKTIQRIISAG